MASPQAHPHPRRTHSLPMRPHHPGDEQHFNICPLHTGRDTLVGWSTAEALQQHEGWSTHSHTHQATEHLFRNPVIKEATMSGAVTQAL